MKKILFLSIVCALLLTGYIIHCKRRSKTQNIDNGKPPVVTQIPSNSPNVLTFHIDRIDPGESAVIPIIIGMGKEKGNLTSQSSRSEATRQPPTADFNVITK